MVPESLPESIFRDRVPEAAARQLATVLASAVEHHLATLEQLCGRKSSSATDIRRQEAICAQMVAQCNDLGVSPSGLRGDPCPRLAMALRALKP
jgi:hypothetical protein